MLHELPAHELKEASPELHARCREWAVRLLGTTEDAGADAINRGFLQCLEESGLTPSEEILAALRYLREAADEEIVPAIPVEFVEHEETRLGREIESFAERMFDLAPETRGTRWDALRDQAGGLQEASWRLDSLIAGLKIDLAAIASEDEDVATLAGLFCRLFAARILDKPVWRRRIRELWKEEPKRLSRATERLTAADPWFAELDSPLIHELTKSKELSRLNTSEPIRFAYRVVPRRPARRPQATASESNPVFLGFLIVAVFGTAVAGVLSSHNQQSKRPKHPPQPPSFNRKEAVEAFLDSARSTREEPLARPVEDAPDSFPHLPGAMLGGADFVPPTPPGRAGGGYGLAPLDGGVTDLLTVPRGTTGGAGPPSSRGEVTDPLDVLKHLKVNP